MRRCLIFLLCWFVTWSFAAAENRVAFIVGNSAYKYVGALENPINDALDMTAALEGLGFRVILGSDTSKEEMRRGISVFGEAAESADVALFYYAGHSFQVSEQNYIVPVDAAISSIDDLNDQTLPLNEVLEAMQKSKGLKLVFLDACRDNPFGAVLDTVPGTRSGLARVSTAADFMFVYATQPDNVAYDGTGRNSFFTEAMLNHIYTPGQDIAELMTNVRRDVLAATGGRQVPWENSSLTQRFRFDNSPVTASEETLLWQVAAKEQDTELMKLYMNNYPQGAHIEDVVAFIEAGSQTRSTATTVSSADAKRLWTLARRTRMRPLLEYYLERYPNGADRAEAERLLSAIPKPEDVTPGGLCERLATHPRDSTAAITGVPFSRLQQNAVAAVRSCAAAVTQTPELPHYTALLARATAASGDLDRAILLYQRASERGDLRAMVSLAQLTEAGNGVPKDPQAALALYEQAAEGGSSDAMINLAITLFEGSQVPKDTERAIDLLRRASDAGSPMATFNFGVLAQDGVLETPDKALEYFQRAARAGELRGYRAAAILLDEGRGVSANPDAAANMLLRGVAADRGELLQQLTERTGDWTRETIAAAQERLKSAGFYTAAIDGLPGPGFSSALEQWRNGGFTADVLIE